MANLLNPSSEEYRARQEQQMSPYQIALRDRQYIPGILSWLANAGRDSFHSDMVAKEPEDPNWPDVATADVGKNGYFEREALERLMDLGIVVPADDPDLLAIKGLDQTNKTRSRA